MENVRTPWTVIKWDKRNREPRPAFDWCREKIDINNWSYGSSAKNNVEGEFRFRHETDAVDFALRFA
jgi:hypothetical protein